MLLFHDLLRSGQEREKAPAAAGAAAACAGACAMAARARVFERVMTGMMALDADQKVSTDRVDL